MKIAQVISENHQGFTLLELLISMLVLSVAFAGILPMFFYSQAIIKNATITNIATGLIQKKMERIINLDYNLIDFRDFDDAFNSDMPEYTYILPEVATRPCTDYPGTCGFINNSSSEYYNKLVDIVEKNGYFFTRVIDIDDPEVPASLENEPNEAFLPSADSMLLRVTITVYWTVPGGKRRSVSAMCEKFKSDQL